MNTSCSRLGAALVLVTCTGCTTLGPVAGMTAASAVPARGTDVELQAAAVPGYYLSSAVQEGGEGVPIGQVSALFEPNELIDLNGLSAGARWVGGDNDGYFEPMARYRQWLGSDQRLALAVVGYGTHANDSASAASYSMTHAGAELGFDARLTPASKWAELHLQWGAALSGLFASGDYCRDMNTGWGVDCPDGAIADTHAEVNDVFPSFHVGMSGDFLRQLGAIHGLRLGVYMGGGWMPEVQDGESNQRRGWASGGASLSVAFGAPSGD